MLKTLFVLVLFLSLACLVCCSQAQVSHSQYSEIDNWSIKKTTDASKIQERLSQLMEAQIKTWCKAAGLKSLPKECVFRVFKENKILEVWAAATLGDTLAKLVSLPICEVDDQAGTKLMEGDGKTPEGFYTLSPQYGSTNWFMWINLNSKQIDLSGAVGQGASFKLWVSYPNAVDLALNKTWGAKHAAGGAIYMHGNCVSIGCISLRNADFCALFYLASLHFKNKNSALQVHIFPNKNTKTWSSINHSNIEPIELKTFYVHLENGFNKFEKRHRPLQWKIVAGNYIFP